MSDQDRWQEADPPERGPSAPPDLRFDPFATAIGVFSAIAIPIIVVGYTRPRGADTLIIVLGIALGLVGGVCAAAWLARRGGRVWRGPEL